MNRRDHIYYVNTDQYIDNLSVDEVNSNEDFSDDPDYEQNGQNAKSDMSNNSGIRNVKKKPPKYCHHVKWTKEENDKLRQLVKEYGDKNWQLISEEMGNRTTRQCKERWKYYLNPKLNINAWTKEEDDLLLDKVNVIGPKWTQITNFFKNRTDAMIKTRYNALMRAKKLEDNKNNSDVPNNINSNKKKQQTQTNDWLKPDQISCTSYFNHEDESSQDDYFHSESDGFAVWN